MNVRSQNLLIGALIVMIGGLFWGLNSLDLNRVFGTYAGARSALEVEAYAIAELYRANLAIEEDGTNTPAQAHDSAVAATVSELQADSSTASQSDVYAGNATSSEGIQTVRDGLRMGLNAGEPGFTKDSSFQFALENNGVCAVFQMSRTIGPTRVVRLDGEKLGVGASCSG